MSAPLYYTAFGIQFSSEIELPLLPSSKTERPIKIVRAKISDEIKQLGEGRHYVGLADGRILCHFLGVGLFLIDPKASVEIDADESASLESIQLILLGSVMGVILQSLEGLVLHGSAINFDGQAVVFSGSPGAGKSTLAIRLAHEGFPILTDDLSLIRFTPEGLPLLISGYPQMKLWRDTLNYLNLNTEKLRSVHGRVDKYNLSVSSSFSERPAPLSSIFILSDRNADETGMSLRRLQGTEAFRAVHNQIYRVEFSSLIGRPQNNFKAVGQILSKVKMFEFRRPDNHCKIDDVIRLLKSTTDESRGVA